MSINEAYGQHFSALTTWTNKTKLIPNSHYFHFSDVIIDPIPFTSSHPQSAPKVRDRESVIPVSCVNLSSDDKDLAQKLEAIAQVGLSLKKIYYYDPRAKFWFSPGHN